MLVLKYHASHSGLWGLKDKNHEQSMVKFQNPLDRACGSHSPIEAPNQSIAKSGFAAREVGNFQYLGTRGYFPG